MLVTLVCCYAACWGPTKAQGVGDVFRHTEGDVFERDASAIIPLVVGVDRSEDVYFAFRSGGVDRGWHVMRLDRRYYFWFFGYVAKLPYERGLD
ncbi:MAG TPA: hypothetical protein QF564_14365 [Pirellulaceae bacterium]|nr:hypothetical protein [Pirellulaceae bacterium]